MAPHIEKAQLISKPTRRSCSKSPSKPGKENEEMPKQSQEQATPPRKISDEFLKVIVPGRKISAPELNRPPVKKGGRRNLFMERCISQEEKENIKTKPPMRKFSTPAIPSISKTNVDENDNAAAKVEAPKTILPVYEVCTKPRNNNNNQSCQITQPKVEESAPIPVNRRYSRPASIIEDIDTEKLLKDGEEDKKSRRISVPMFHISQEGSSNNNTGSRKLYTERCISTEEKENIKSKPIAKKPPKEKPPNTTNDINDHDSDSTKDSKATKDTTEAKETKEISNGKKLLEKVKLKPKSAQRKLSAPAKMMTPPPITSPAVNGHDLLSSGIILDGRGGGVGIDTTLPLRREEDGKPSFANAAKVVHAKVQVVSCFRSSGAMPIPKIPKHPPMAPIRPPKPRQILPSTKEAQEIDLDIPLETCEELHEDYLDERFLTETKVPRLSRCMVYPSPKVISVSTFKGISDVMLTNRPMKIPLPPPCPSEYMTGSCEKHSRCHCNLLSKNERDFFKVTPQK